MGDTNTYELRYAVSVTPVEKIGDGVDGNESRWLSAIDDAVGKTLGGKGTNASTVIQGYAEGNAVYTNSNITISSGDSVFIKNTGFLYVDADDLGAATTASFTVGVGTQDIAVLGAGEAIYLPNVPNTTIKITNASDVAIEYIAG